MFQSAAIYAFPVLMATAGIYDALTMTIPNRISLALIAGFAVAALLVGMPLASVGSHVGAAAFMLAAGFVCFQLGWMGGGDAKIATAAALWIGWGGLLEYALIFSILGGVLTLLLLIGRRLPMPPLVYRAEWLARLLDPRGGIPYGIALAFAALIVFPHTSWNSLVAF